MSRAYAASPPAPRPPDQPRNFRVKISSPRPLLLSMAGTRTSRGRPRRKPRAKKELDHAKVERLKRALDEGTLGIDYGQLVDSLAHAMRSQRQGSEADGGGGVP